MPRMHQTEFGGFVRVSFAVAIENSESPEDCAWCVLITREGKDYLLCDVVEVDPQLCKTNDE